MGKICRNCGKRYDDRRDVCLFCGSQLTLEETTSQEEQTLDRSDIRTLVTVLIIVAFLAGVLFLIFAVGPDFWREAVQNIFMREGMVGR
ncbi:MAG: hypothetical protein GF409_03440 [Candidatus Omnitrophica bacterium]|nr:hypothetical protein [Candidatus Omnitrophota bacterium]